MFRVLCYNRKIKFYTDNVCASLTNAMSAVSDISSLKVLLNVENYPLLMDKHLTPPPPLSNSAKLIIITLKGSSIKKIIVFHLKRLKIL